MQMKDLKPAKTLVQRYGVKMIMYGKAGTAKTPMLNTAPRPLLLATENGLQSMKNSNVPTWQAFTPARVKEFFDWFMKSNEAKNFDTLGIDSASQLAENELDDLKPKFKDPRKAYGKMADNVMSYLEPLYFMPEKHIYLICKETQGQDGETGPIYKKPSFPGNDLNTRVPHRYDQILHAEYIRFAGMSEDTLAIRCKQCVDIHVRDRSGTLAEFEPPDLSVIFNKILKG